MKKIILAFLCGVIPYLLAGCGSDRHDGLPAGWSGAIAFSLSLNTSSPPPEALMALQQAADVCDYEINTVNATVTNSSGQTVATASWPCSAHQGTLSNVPVGTVDVVLEGLVGTTVAWSGQKSGVIVTAGQTTDAGNITLDYKGTDVFPPTIQSVNPANGATGVSLGASVSAVFSEPVVATSVNTSTFILTCGTNVTGTISYDKPTRTATFDPNSSLPASSPCTATITTGVEDLAGLHMVANYPWSFTTGTAPPTTGIWDVSTWDNALWGT